MGGTVAQVARQNARTCAPRIASRRSGADLQTEGIVCGALVEIPPRFVEEERHAIAHFLHLPGSALPRRGHLELAAAWNWQDLGSIEASVVVKARLRAERTRTTRATMEAILRGTLDSRP